MNEQQLRYIQKIAEEGSIQKASVLCRKNPSTLTRVLRNMEKELGAAEELYLAQPSLSQMVKELEADLGRKVFVRKREGVEETEFGRKLLDRLEMVKKQFHQMRVELEEFQQMNKVLFKSLFGSGGFGVLSP